MHVVGWSLGGDLRTARPRPTAALPIASITVVGAPIDVSQVPLVAPLRPLLNLTDGRLLITRLYRLTGGAPRPLVRWAFQLSSFQKLVTRPLAVATHLDDADFLAQIEAVDRFTDNMTAYPGRTLRPALPPVRAQATPLAPVRFELGDRTVDRSAITAPVLVFAGSTDGIAPVNAVKAVVPLLTGSPDVRFEIVPGGHLGMLTGRSARGTTWRVLDEWVDQWSQPEEPAAPPVVRRRSGRDRKTAATKAPAQEGRREEGAGQEGRGEEDGCHEDAARRRPRRGLP